MELWINVQKVSRPTVCINDAKCVTIKKWQKRENKDIEEMGKDIS